MFVVGETRLEDLEGVNDRDLRALVHDLNRQAANINAQQLQAVTEFEERGLHRVDGCPSVVNWCQTRLGHTRAESAAITRRTKTVSLLPTVLSVLADGRVTASHLDVINTIRPHHPDEELAANETELVAILAGDTAEKARVKLVEWSQNLLGPADKQERAARAHRSRSVTTSSRVGGMGAITVESPTELHREFELHLRQIAKELWKANNNGPEPLSGTLTYTQLMHDAFTQLVRRSKAFTASGRTGLAPVSAEVMVLITPETLTGLNDDDALLDGAGPLDAGTARRMACNATISGLTVGADGETLELGRSQRPANRAQRRALKAEYGGCAHPDCGVPFEWCQIHHINQWIDGGSTDLDNLIPLCSGHHHLLHQQHWQTSQHNNWIFQTPNGQTVTTKRRTKPNRKPDREPEQQKPDRQKQRTPEPGHRETGQPEHQKPEAA